MDYEQSRAWIAAFKNAWDARTKYHDGSVEPGYTGIDYSVPNQWTSYDAALTVRYSFGAEYRKEISPSDELGTYQASSFVLAWTPRGFLGLRAYHRPYVAGTVQFHDHYFGAAGFKLINGGSSLNEIEQVDLFAYDPVALVKSFWNEVGLYY
jgi:hypothetical protein